MSTSTGLETLMKGISLNRNHTKESNWIGNRPTESLWISLCGKESGGILYEFAQIQDFSFSMALSCPFKRQSTFQISDSGKICSRFQEADSRRGSTNSRFQISEPPFRHTRGRRGRLHIPDSKHEASVHGERTRFRLADSRIIATQIPDRENHESVMS